MATTKQLRRDQPATTEGRGSSFFTNTETSLQVLNTCCPDGSSARSPGTKRGQQASLRDFGHLRSYSGGCRLNEGLSRESNGREPAGTLFPETREGQGKAATGGQGRHWEGKGWPAAARRAGGQESCRIRQHHSRRGECPCRWTAAAQVQTAAELQP